MKKIIFSLICFLLILIVTIGILMGKGKDKSKEDLTKITVAEVAHSIFYAPMYVADSLGYFEEEGIDADIILTSGADAVASSVMSGDAQIGFCGSEQSIYIYNGGEEDYLVNFAGLTKRDGSFIIGRENKEFNIEDLKGSHIIAGREGGMPSMTLAYTLNENGIELDELNFDTSIAFASMSGAFIGGTGDYVALFEPTGLQLEKQGYGYVVASLGELGGEVPYTTFMSRKSYLDSNKDIIDGFTKAIQKGLDYTFNHSDEALAEIITDYFPDTSLNDLTETIKRYREADSWYKTTYITEEGFERVQEIMDNSDKLEKKVPFDKLVDNKFNKEK